MMMDFEEFERFRLFLLSIRLLTIYTILGPPVADVVAREEIEVVRGRKECRTDGAKTPYSRFQI